MAFPTIRRLVSSVLNRPASNQTKEPALNGDVLWPASGPIHVRCRHLSPAVAGQVEAWFKGDISERELSGNRSVIIAHPEDPSLRLKIKGAGYKGEQLLFHRQHRSGLIQPRFDFDGRMTPDVASGHDNAYLGGASFQHVVVEYDMSARLSQLGYAVIPCLGYGTVTRQGRTSWFSVFEWADDCVPVRAEDLPMDYYAQAYLRVGREVVELATKHNLIGYFWYATRSDGSWYLKDLHPFYTADPVNMSKLSWTMQVFFALHITSLAALHGAASKQPDRPPDLQAYPFRAVAPGASREEHEALRYALVAPYMRQVPTDFDRNVLFALLQEHRLTRELMALCPPEYVDISPEC
jgi:hypothetical protein